MMMNYYYLYYVSIIIACLTLITIIFALIKLILQFKKDRKRNYKKIFTWLVVIIICIAGFSYLIENNFYYYPQYSGDIIPSRIKIGLYDNPYVELNELGLDNDSQDNVTLDTYKLEIVIINHDKTERVIFDWRIVYLTNRTRAIRIKYPYVNINIDDPEINYRYPFTIRYIINSTDPDIMNMDYMGNNNTISGTFSLNDTHVDIEIDTEFENQITMTDDSKLILPFDQMIYIMYFPPTVLFLS